MVNFIPCAADMHCACLKTGNCSRIASESGSLRNRASLAGASTLSVDTRDTVTRGTGRSADTGAAGSTARDTVVAPAVSAGSCCATSSVGLENTRRTGSPSTETATSVAATPAPGCVGEVAALSTGVDGTACENATSRVVASPSNIRGSDVGAGSGGGGATGEVGDAGDGGIFQCTCSEAARWWPDALGLVLAAASADGTCSADSEPGCDDGARGTDTGAGAATACASSLLSSCVPSDPRPEPILAARDSDGHALFDESGGLRSPRLSSDGNRVMGNGAGSTVSLRVGSVEGKGPATGRSFTTKPC